MLDQVETKQELAQESALKISSSCVAGSQRREIETILLVEDEARVRNVTHQVLEAAGYHVLVAGTATEAMQMSLHERKRPSVLITDVILPDRNGLDLARELSSELPHLKTVVISGYPENDITRNSPQSGDMYYLAKPFSVDSLVRAVRQVLAGG